MFVEASFAEVLRRACQRDGALFGSVDAVRARYLKRYIPGQRLYLQAVQPQRHADVVIDNNEPMNAKLVTQNAY